jgi:hypothetical protein
MDVDAPAAAEQPADPSAPAADQAGASEQPTASAAADTKKPAEHAPLVEDVFRKLPKCATVSASAVSASDKRSSQHRLTQTSTYSSNFLDFSDARKACVPTFLELLSDICSDAAVLAGVML